VKLLLDTQALLWWVNDNPKLGPLARTAIADRGNDVLVSVASFWEISIKHRIGKLEDSGPAVMQEALENGFHILGIEAAHLEALEALTPLEGHKDPFDHLILVQAQAEDAILVTSDRHLRSYDLRCL
jgi:PIN domain nuclease of toxin-antitoxin system